MSLSFLLNWIETRHQVQQSLGEGIQSHTDRQTQTDYVHSVYIKKKKNKIKNFPIWQLQVQSFCDPSAFFPHIFPLHKFAGTFPLILHFTLATSSPCSYPNFSLGNIFLILPSLKVCIPAELLLLWCYGLENIATRILLWNEKLA